MCGSDAERNQLKADNKTCTVETIVTPADATTKQPEKTEYQAKIACEDGFVDTSDDEELVCTARTLENNKLMTLGKWKESSRVFVA